MFSRAVNWNAQHSSSSIQSFSTRGKQCCVGKQNDNQGEPHDQLVIELAVKIKKEDKVEKIQSH